MTRHNRKGSVSSFCVLLLWGLVLVDVGYAQVRGGRQPFDREMAERQGKLESAICRAVTEGILSRGLDLVPLKLTDEQESQLIELEQEFQQERRNVFRNAKALE